MRKILLIETSATLRHALKKLLLQFGYDVTVESGFETGLQQLTGNDDVPFEGIVLGWPSRTQTSTDELLTVLGDTPFNAMPLLILAHEADSGKLGWVSGRTHTAFLLWENYQDSTRILPQLLNQQLVQPCVDTGPDTPIRILLVDDSPTARVKFRKLLDSCGYEVVTAACAEEAINKALEECFDIAIVDYFMPDKNGDALCRELRSDPRTANIIPAVLTSTYLDKVIQTSLAAGAVECMFKNEADDLFKTRVAAMSRSIRITKRIEQERTRLEGILSSVGDGVYGVDNDGLITFVNPATCQLLGYRADTELIGFHPKELFHKYDGESEKIGTIDIQYLETAIHDGQQLHGVESIFTRTDGTPIQVEMTIFPLNIEDRREGAVVAFRDVSVRKLLEEELKWQANHDPLTKLLNRKYMEDALEQEVHRMARSEEYQSALLYLDLDRFKYINDTIGHAAGDQLLMEIGDLLHTRLRKSDVLARLGGDEFGILLRDVTEQTVVEVAETFRELLVDYTFVRNGRDYHINASIGIALIDRHTHTAGEVLSNADIACHMAKGHGRNQTHIYSPEADDRASMDLELGWSFRLHKALEKDTFQLYYQPIIALQDIDVDALPSKSGVLWQRLMEQGVLKHNTFEVLLRLHNSYGEPISPNAFLPTAERFNMMQKIDHWVINAAMEKMAALREQDKDVTFTINLSGQSMDPANLVPLFQQGIAKWGIEPSRFLFEITESCAINDTHSACFLIDELSDLGCRFALDDFGSGYCSFSHLKRLPVEYIKIDGMFVKDILTDPMDMAIVRSITNIAHTLGKKTVAEFVESGEALRTLKDCGVDYVQGYYVAMPSPNLPSAADGGQDQADSEQQAR